MVWRRTWPAAMLCTTWLASSCTALREIPRGDYAARPERHACRLWTRDGLVYDFDYARVEHDTLVGFRERAGVEAADPADAVASTSIALEDIERLTTRTIDWRRTGLIGGGVLAGILVASAAHSAGSSPGTLSGGGGGGGVADRRMRRHRPSAAPAPAPTRSAARSLGSNPPALASQHSFATPNRSVPPNVRSGRRSSRVAASVSANDSEACWSRSARGRPSCHRRTAGSGSAAVESAGAALAGTAVHTHSTSRRRLKR